MNTPIYDFVNDYASGNPVRLHMPGHKGILDAEQYCGFNSLMKYDITEIDGADYLSAPCGIILESEANASRLFGCHTFYSTEGSSLCIRAMMFLIKKYAKRKGHEPLILAGRNAHASFVNACAVLDIDVEWIMQRECDSYETCYISGKDLEKYIEECIREHNIDDKKIEEDNKEKNNIEDNYVEDTVGNLSKLRLPDALYVTSPDYLGNMLDIKELASVCHKYGILLLVDNAHGAYLKFLEQSLHPIDLGADMCCDSAHKTLPVLTGGAYLHISACATGIIYSVSNCRNDKASIPDTCSFLEENARQALSVFATTSPSYLILQSLDLCNSFLYGNTSICEAAEKVGILKKKLIENGYRLIGDEPLKITLLLKKVLHLLLAHLQKSGIYVEYHDEEHIVMMFSVNTTEEEFRRVEETLTSFSLEYKCKLEQPGEEESLYNSEFRRKKTPVRAMSFKEAMLSCSEQVDAEKSVGRILAQPVLNCPPCVPLYMCGEIIGEDIKRYCKGKVAVVLR